MKNVTSLLFASRTTYFTTLHTSHPVFRISYLVLRISYFGTLQHAFERIHPFQDSNVRVGRLIMFKECLAHHIVPFIITDALKAFYYRGLANWPHLPGYLRDTCLTAQDNFKIWLVKFGIKG